MRDIKGTIVRPGETVCSNVKKTTDIDYITIVNTLLTLNPKSVNPESELYQNAVNQYNQELVKGSTKRLEIPEGFCGYINPATNQFRVEPDTQSRIIPGQWKYDPSTLTTAPTTIDPIQYPIDQCLAIGLPGSKPYNTLCSPKYEQGAIADLNWPTVDPNDISMPDCTKWDYDWDYGYELPGRYPDYAFPAGVSTEGTWYCRKRSRTGSAKVFGTNVSLYSEYTPTFYTECLMCHGKNGEECVPGSFRNLKPFTPIGKATKTASIAGGSTGSTGGGGGGGAPGNISSVTSLPQKFSLTASINGGASRVSFGGYSGNIPNTAAWNTGDGAIGVVCMYRANGSGGKFDWIRTGGQSVKGLENIYGGYGGHTIPNHGETVKFVWISSNGKERSAIATTTWP